MTSAEGILPVTLQHQAQWLPSSTSGELTNTPPSAPVTETRTQRQAAACPGRVAFAHMKAMTSVQPHSNTGWQGPLQGTSALPFVPASVVKAGK